MELKKFNYKIVNSTNDLAIRLIKSKNIRSGIVIAQKQKKGRGQYGNEWISYKGNLFVSVFFPITKIKLSLKNMTTINCLLVKKILTNFYKGKILTKKPNDILINKNKISGILQETVSNYDDKFIIIGIGINLIKSPKTGTYLATNLLDLTGKRINSRNMALRLKKIYEKFIPKILNLKMREISIT